ncbi:hypothetical protein QNI19_19640 [Cytophagaceae bacterium DM2B3-1]|uniref:Uncharacterized protein n=1 Tax=Xanthocytophaga flava TaxID=3048013 RepID=A0AAE3U9B3_9BACT|nr:hypothetical protein [Xanthocytophaga flavus]MDJ1473088.1 hypothetical protein [Xanthocytophaga flavus]MDJ1484321.1 hypothetical protein [Xanthocytophaga flavus]MDJ1495162.1 hypothetical protein [Xanthocytophaga flavus]
MSQNIVYPKIYHLSAMDYGVPLTEFKPADEKSFCVRVEITIQFKEGYDFIQSYGVMIASTKGYIKYLDERTTIEKNGASTIYLLDKVVLMERYDYEHFLGFLYEKMSFYNKLGAKQSAIALATEFDWLNKDESFDIRDFYKQFFAKGF